MTTKYDVLKYTGVENRDEVFDNLSDDAVIISAGLGSDYILSNEGSDFITGGQGRDYIIDKGGRNLIVGDDDWHAPGGDDDWIVSAGIDTIYAGGGNDFVNAGAGDDIVDGGYGNDILWGGHGVDALIGGAGNDVIYGGSAGHVSFSFTIVTNFSGVDDTPLGNQEWSAHPGSIALDDVSNDYIDGGEGDDLLFGQGGNDTLFGNTGDDTLNGGSGRDEMDGGTGNDTYYVDSAQDAIIETSSGGTADRAYTTVSHSLAKCVENLYASGSSSLSLTGNTAANSIKGNGAANKINGGLGKDVLYGSSGKDTFIFNTKLSSSNVDKLADYKVADDTIHLENGIFTKLKAGKLASDAFWKGTKAADKEDRIIYDAAKGYLYYDADGTGPSKQVLFATMAKKLKMTASEFVVI